MNSVTNALFVLVVAIAVGGLVGAVEISRLSAFVMIAAGLQLSWQSYSEGARRLRVPGFLMILVGVWGLWLEAAHGAVCSWNDEPWIVTDQTGAATAGPNEAGQIVVDSRREALGSGYDTATIQSGQDSALWEGCTRLLLVVDYDLALDEVIPGSSPIAVAVVNGVPGFWSENQGGLVGRKTGTWSIVIPAPYANKIEVTTWLNGTTKGHATATVTTFQLEGRNRISDDWKAWLREVCDQGDRVTYGLSVTTAALAKHHRAEAKQTAEMAVIFGLGSRLLRAAVDHDPFDPDYKKVWTPRFRPVPDTITTRWRRALWENEDRFRLLSKALYIAVNRANSAEQMGDAIAEDKQQEAIDSLLIRIGVRLGLEADLRLEVASRMKTPEFAALEADPDLIAALRKASAEIAP
jgi:hypothetical protein